VREGTKTALLEEGWLDEGIVQRAIAVAEEAPLDDRVATGLEAVVAIAETDPAAARSALVALRADHAMLARLEACLGEGAERATFGLGGAIQLALSELASADPNLRGKLPELRRWLEGKW
jgi:hypothetical protein